jgi:electron transfer flavoprotein beta subunit
MNILVCLKEVVDTALSLDTGLRNRLVFREGLPLRLNPDDIRTLAMALDIKSVSTSGDSTVTVISIGPGRVEEYLREALSSGADKAIRIWGDDFTGLSPYQKAKLLYAYVSLHSFDLVFTGAKSLDTANGQVGQLLAARLGWPCVSDVVSLEDKDGNIRLSRGIGRGKREVLEATLPAVITVKGDSAVLPYASVDRLIDSVQNEIEVKSPADLSVTPAELKEEPARITGLMAPRPRPRKVPAPSGSLPAFDRILKLLEGGISRRRGEMLKGGTEELAEQLYQLFLTEGVIKPAAER